MLKWLCACQYIQYFCSASIALFSGQLALAEWLNGCTQVFSQLAWGNRADTERKELSEGAVHSPPDRFEINGLYQSVHPVPAAFSRCFFHPLFTLCTSVLFTHLSLFLAQMPNLREKSILLVKMMTYIEKRFPDDLELNAQFLDLVNYVYR